jgi:hypothetical protein
MATTTSVWWLSDSRLRLLAWRPSGWLRHRPADKDDCHRRSNQYAHQRQRLSVRRYHEPKPRAKETQRANYFNRLDPLYPSNRATEPVLCINSKVMVQTSFALELLCAPVSNCSEISSPLRYHRPVKPYEERPERQRDVKIAVLWLPGPSQCGKQRWQKQGGDRQHHCVVMARERADFLVFQPLVSA